VAGDVRRMPVVHNCYSIGLAVSGTPREAGSRRHPGNWIMTVMASARWGRSYDVRSARPQKKLGWRCDDGDGDSGPPRAVVRDVYAFSRDITGFIIVHLQVARHLLRVFCADKFTFFVDEYFPKDVAPATRGCSRMILASGVCVGGGTLGCQ